MKNISCYSLSRYFTLILCVLLVTTLNPVIAAQPIKVAYLSRPIERPFWNHFLKLMQAAADDLGITLEVKISSNNIEELKQDGKTLLNSRNKPDYFITGFLFDATDELLDIAEQRDIRTVIVNSNIASNIAIGAPREKYRHWIGHLYPDDVASGYQLIDILIAQYRLQHKTRQANPVNIIGVSGRPNSSASLFRLAGMKARVRSLPNANLQQILHCHWQRECAESVTHTLLTEYPDTAIIWAASDLLALGAIDAAGKTGRQPGRDIYVGGVDWSPPGLKAISDGTMSVSLGGHFAEGVWALVMIYDYHHGIDFMQDPGLHYETRMGAITANNVDKYLGVLSKQNWDRVDFRRYTKFHNKSLKKYQFQIESIFDELTATD